MKKKMHFYHIGQDVIIDQTVIFKYPEKINIGNHVAIDAFTYIGCGIILGDYIHVSASVSIIGGKNGKLIMEDFSAMATGCRIICGSSDYAKGSGHIVPFVPEKYKSKEIIKPVIFKKHAALGTNVVVLPGITIGEGAIVGAGSVVTKDIVPWTINVGVPTRVVGKRPKKNILKYAKEMGY